MSYANSEDPDQHVHPCSLIWAFFLSSTYTTVSIYSVRGQEGPKSACANAQADFGLSCPQIA